MKFEIKHRFSNVVLFSMEANTLKQCVEAAVASKAILLRANLSEAILLRADLSGANLSGADLSEANLFGANLSGTNLSGADLSGADLFRANLFRANLSGAYLFGYKLADASPLFLLGTPDGWYAYTYQTDSGEQRVHVGCRDFTIEAGRRYWAGNELRREVLAALDYAEAVGKARGWTK